MIKEFLNVFRQVIGNLLDQEKPDSDHIPDEFRIFLEKNPECALKNMEKAADEFLTRFYEI
jgi:hypothetical protein